MTARLRTLAALGLLLCAEPASAALTRMQLDGVTAAPSVGATVPLDLMLTDLRGSPETLGQALGGRPAMLMLADYRCTQLCGSILAIAAQALHATALSPTQDFTLAVVGFNPDAGSREAAALRDADLGAYPDLAEGARMLTGTPAAVERLQHAVGFTAVREAAADRFAHPADLYVLTADGRVSRVLNGLSLDPDSTRLALVEAGQGRIGSLVDRLHVLCYGLDPLTGASTDLAQTMLRVGASLTLLCAALVFATRWRGWRAGRRA